MTIGKLSLLYMFLLSCAVSLIQCSSLSDEERWVEQRLRTMSVRDKVGQMIAIPGSIARYDTSTEYRMEIERWVTDYNIGAAFINFGTVDQTVHMINSLQNLAETPLLFWSGGLAHRTVWGSTQFPESMAFTANGPLEDIFEAGRIVGREGRAMGFHYNGGPVVDVNINPENPIINIRSFSEDPEIVTDMAEAFIRGARESGIICAAKHFPGHGDTFLDSHLALPVVDAPRTRLEAIEFFPYRRLIEAGILESVETAHIYYPAIDGDKPLPSTVSKRLITEILKEDMGLPGLIWTDGMRMKGITAMFTDGEAAIRSIEAGHDVVVYFRDISVVDSITAAVESGRLSVERIDRSVRRILRRKAGFGLHQSRVVDSDRAKIIVGSDDHTAKARAITEKSITMLVNKNLLPVSADKIGTLPLLFFPSKKAVGPSNLNLTYTHLLEPALRKIASGFKAWYQILPDMKEQDIQKILSQAAASDLVVVCAYLNVAHQQEIDFMKKVLEQVHKNGKKIALISLINPYLIRRVPFVDAFVTGYGTDEWTLNAAFRVLTGQLNPAGKLSVTIPDLFDRGFGLHFR